MDHNRHWIIRGNFQTEKGKNLGKIFSFLYIILLITMATLWSNNHILTWHISSLYKKKVVVNPRMYSRKPIIKKILEDGTIYPIIWLKEPEIVPTIKKEVVVPKKVIPKRKKTPAFFSLMDRAYYFIKYVKEDKDHIAKSMAIGATAALFVNFLVKKRSKGQDIKQRAQYLVAGQRDTI